MQNKGKLFGDVGDAIIRMSHLFLVVEIRNLLTQIWKKVYNLIPVYATGISKETAFGHEEGD